jgi:hypothetical protein
VGATATSDLPVTFSAKAGSACTVSGATVTIAGAGTCTVVAQQAGNGNYNAAPAVERSFTIAKGVATISLSNLTGHTYNGSSFAATATTNPAGSRVSR